MSYDSAPDTRTHIALVGMYLGLVVEWLQDRARVHDASKLVSPEKEVFDVFRSKLDSLDIQSAEYKRALVEMGEGLKHHYRVNSHHPEHYENGINGMNLLDVIEMVCDWTAAAQRNDPNGKVNLQWARERFGIDAQLESVIKNTLGLFE